MTRYEVKVRNLSLGDAQNALARLRAGGLMAAMELQDDKPNPRDTIPFRLVRHIESLELGTFAGYCGEGRFVFVNSAGEPSDEQVAEFECVDGHGGYVDWP